MSQSTPEEEAALNEVMQLLEAQPVDTTSANSLVSFANDDQTPAQREKLAILVSTGKAKEAISVQVTHDQVKRLSDKDVQKYLKRYEAYIGNKTTDSLIDSALMLLTKGVGLAVPIDVKELQKNSRTTTLSTRSFHPLLETLHFDAVDGWHWPMLPLSPQSTSSLKKKLNMTYHLLHLTHQPETAKIIH